MGEIKKRQHYVPITYLKQFSSAGRSNDMIWAYFLKQKSLQFVALDDVCVEKYLYEHYICYEDGGTEFISPNTIENGHMLFENEYNSVINKIINSQNDVVSLTCEERNILTGFIVSMMFRHPTFVKLANALHEKFYDEHPEWKKESTKKFPNIDDLYIKMSCLHVMLAAHQDPNRNLSIQAMKRLFDEKQLCVLNSRTREFITSDTPVVNICGEINGLGYNLMGLPVSPDHFVAFIDIDINVANKVFPIDDEQTMRINKYQYGRLATGIIMSKSKDELEKQIAELSK